ncbi:MAG: T9SS type A sorting domain-containing protein, partial [Bacteroidetes bacterium]
LSNAVGIPEINTIANPDIFPNPTEGDFSLSCGMDDFRIDIFSELGKRVYSENRNSRSSLFDISGFRDGIYFFRITDNKSDPQGAAVTYTGKIIVK